VAPPHRFSRFALGFLILGFAGCADRADCPRCDTLVIASVGEPDALLPPLVGESVGRDVSDLIYERLADLPGGGSPLDSSALQPRLATRWERVDPVTLRFHLRRGARWQDSVPVTAADVVFSFEAYADSALDAQARPVLAGRITATAQDDSTVLIRFAAPDPEQWYDATWHVRVLPKHVWDSIPRGRWAGTPAESRVMGSGRYRLGGWVKGQTLTLERNGSAEEVPIGRVIWRFAGDPDAALNLLLTHEADLLESVGDSGRVARVMGDSTLTAVSYPSAVYGFLGFNLDAPASSPVTSREVRQSLAMALDRSTAARAALGPGTVAPPGPMSRSLWIFDESTPVPPFDSAGAASLLDQQGWKAGSDGVRRRGGRPLAVDILVPGSSAARKNLAVIAQEMWRRAGVTATVTIVDFPVFQERIRTGKFQSFIGAWLDEPSPRGLADQWTTAGIGALNYSHYRSPAFDSLFRRASSITGSVAEGRAAWRAAMTQLNQDVPAIWLYNPTSTAGVARRVEGVRIDPYSWLAGIGSWKLAK
jgi:peptide/nickel transport system substrate-binding protein